MEVSQFLPDGASGFGRRLALKTNFNGLHVHKKIAANLILHKICLFFKVQFLQKIMKIKKKYKWPYITIYFTATADDVCKISCFEHFMLRRSTTDSCQQETLISK